MTAKRFQFIFLLLVCAFSSLVWAQTEKKNEEEKKFHDDLEVTSGLRPLPRELYSHDVHEKPLTEQGFDCTHCHPFKLDWNEKKAGHVPEYESLFIKPLKDLCHDCHRKEARVRKNVFVCYLCHHDNRDILPSDHRSGWLKQHGSVGTLSKQCRDCHEDSYCVDCHRRFEPVRPKVHSRNYRFFHSIEGRMSPASCYSCHRQSSCVECHKTGRTFR